MNKQREWMDKLAYFLKGNTAAVILCTDIMYIAHLWDDLVDNDSRTVKAINQAFIIALIDIPANPFYQQYSIELRSIILNCILQWQDANKLEIGNEHDKHMAYMLRAAPLQLFNYCAYLIGGQDWYEEVGPDMRRLYEEELENFLEEFSHA